MRIARPGYGQRHLQRHARFPHVPGSARAPSRHGRGLRLHRCHARQDGMCTIGLHNSKLGLAVVMHYKKRQLPALANWQHWGPGEYVTGLEPGTNPPIGQARLASRAGSSTSIRARAARTISNSACSPRSGTSGGSSRRRVEYMAGAYLCRFRLRAIQAGLFAKEAFQSGQLSANRRRRDRPAARRCRAVEQGHLLRQRRSERPG